MVAQQEDHDEEDSEEEQYPIYTEEEPPAGGSVPGLDLRFVHCFGMMVVAVVILAIVSSMNGGYRGAKGGESLTVTAPVSGAGSADHASAGSTLSPEAETARSARTIRYLNAVTAACQDTNDALAQMQIMLGEYSASPEIRKDSDWRNRIASPLLAADGAAEHLLALSDPPFELSTVNRSLRLAGRELRSSVHKFALTIETGNSLYMNAAAEHQRNCKRMADQAADVFVAYRKANGY